MSLQIDIFQKKKHQTIETQYLLHSITFLFALFILLKQFSYQIKYFVSFKRAKDSKEKLKKNKTKKPDRFVNFE